TDLYGAATARPPVRIRTGRRAGPTTRDESKCQRTGDERAHGWPPSGKPRHSIGQQQGSERFGRAPPGRPGDRPQTRQQLNPTERCTTSRRPSRGRAGYSEPGAELRIVVADDNLRYAIHGGVSGLLRAPLVGRCIRHRGMEDRSATLVQEEEHEHLAEPDVEGLDEVTCPRHMVSQERRPALAVTSATLSVKTGSR